jgi:hypothetical protein
MPDVVPTGGDAQLCLDISWRNSKPEDAADTRPDDAKPIQLVLRKRTSAATGDVRFDAADGPTTKGFSTDAHQILTLHGQAATSGAEADVVLDVKIEDEVRSTIPVTVGAAPVALEIKAENGTDPAPGSLMLGAPVRLKAVTTPDTAGDFEWVPLNATGMRINGAADTDTAEVEATGTGTGPRIVCSMFTPSSGPGIVAGHVFATGANFAGQIEDRSVAPNFAGTTHIFLASHAFEVVDSGGTVVASGTTDADGKFAVALSPGRRYELRITDFQGLAP